MSLNREESFGAVASTLRDAPQSLSYNPWPVLIVWIMPAAFLFTVDRQSMTVLAPMIERQFGFDLVTMTKILAAGQWAYALAQLPAAWLAERYGPQRLLGLATVLWSVSVACTAIATNVWTFVLCRIALGIGQAPDWTSSMMILQRTFRATLRARASSLMLGALYFGTFSSGPISVAIGQRWGWPICFYMLGGVTFVFGSAMLMLFRRLPSDIADARADSERRAGAGSTWIQFAKSRQVYALGAAYFSLAGIQSFFFSLLPLYLVGKRHLTFAAMGWLASTPLVTLAISALGAGWVSDHILRRTGSLRTARVPLAIGGIVGSAFLFAGGIARADTTTMMVLLCLGSTAIGLGQVAVWSSVQDLSAGSGAIAAFIQFLAHFSFGGVPIVAAYLVRMTGEWNDIGYLIVLLGSLGGAAFCLVDPQRPILRQQPVS